MKNLVLSVLALALLNCSSQKLETAKIPFTMEQSSFKEIISGKEETGVESELRIKVLEDANDIQFEKVYFRGLALDCQVNTKNDVNTILAKYSSKDTMNETASKDGLKMQKKFELKKDEAILAYTDTDGKIKYVKVEGIKEKAPVAYPSRPKN